MVEEHISDEDFSVQKLSSLMAMERTVLYRKMQTLTQVSPSEYIRSIRMNVATRLLKETDFPISEIAQRTGFSSTKYFSQVFKKSYGVMPSEYRDDN